MANTITRTDVVGLIACLPHELGHTPRPSTLVVCVLDTAHVASITLPLANALLAGAPDVVVDAVRDADGAAVVVIAYHEACIDTVAHIATRSGPPWH